VSRNSEPVGIDGGHRSAKLDVEPSLQTVEPARIDQYRGLRSFLERVPGSWEVRWDLRSDRPHLVQGGGPQVLDSSTPPRDLDEVQAAVQSFLKTNEAFLGVEIEDLALNRDRSSSAADGAVWLLEFEQSHQGIPVEDASVFLRINHGRVVQFGTRSISDVRASSASRVSQHRAEVVARDRFAGTEVEIRTAELRFIPTLPVGQRRSERYVGASGEGYEHLLAWSIQVRSDSPRRSFRVVVDATTSEVLAVEDLSRFATASLSGGVASFDPGAMIASTPFAFAAIENDGAKTTDEVGAYDYSGGDATVRLDGPYVDIDDRCGVIQFTDSTDGIIDLGVATATDCGNPGYGGLGNTNAARSAFFYLTGMNRKAATFFPENTWLDEALTAHTNESGPFLCNAYWDGESVNFFSSGGGCANTGEIPAVLLHEFGHGLEYNTGGYAPDVGSSEALADTVAFLETGEACVGSGFFLDGESCPNCRAECDGVRDLAAFAQGGESVIARPDTIAAVDGIDCGRFSCPYEIDGFASQGPMGYESHCASYIGSTANWDLHQSLMEIYGESDGTAVMEDLWYGSLGAAQSMFQVVDGGSCNPSAEVNGCAADNWYTVFLAVDDNDGDLSNGTPNGCRIWDAYNAHGIACGARPVCSEDANQAPSVTIVNPMTAETYSGGAVIEFEAAASDLEEGDVSATLEWSSNRDGALGIGGSIQASLSVGTHVITAKATDSEGASSSDLIALFVEGELAYVVTKFEDTDDGVCDEDCSLREAIIAANGNPGLDTVTLPAGEYTVTRSGSGAGAGDLNIEDALKLVGVGAATTVIEADGNNDRVFTVDAPDVEISGVTIRGGYTVGLNLFSSGPGGLGGGVYVAEAAGLLLDHCWLTDNNVTAATAGSFGGGALYAAPGSEVVIANSTVSDNLSTGLSTVTEQRGGGLYVDSGAIVDVVDSTISGNVTTVIPPFFDYSDTSGAYVVSGGLLTLTQTTVTGNAPVGYDGGLSIDEGATVTLANTIVDGVCDGVAVSLGGNVESPGATCALDLSGDLSEVLVDELALGELDLTVGETPVHLLGETSVAIDQALTDLCGAFDQLDRPRMADGDGDGEGRCDVGAIEREALVLSSAVFQSIPIEDASLAELSAGAGVGDLVFDGKGARALRIGDHMDGRQSRLITSFDLSTLPEGVEIVGAMLRMNFGGSEGDDPFASHGMATVDLSVGGFGGDPAIAGSDFEAASDAAACAVLIADAEADGWATAALDSFGVSLLDRNARAQLRVAFELAEDGDGMDDFAGYHSGDAADEALRPELVITYKN